MLNFKQFLEEGRDAPLYHGVRGPGDLTRMLHDDCIKPHVDIGLSDNRITKRVRTREYPRSSAFVVSVTRSLAYGFEFRAFSGYSPPVIQLNQIRLSQSYKITPYNWFYHASYGTSREEVHARSKTSWDNQMEEKVFTGEKGIFPLSRYLEKIIIKDFEAWYEPGRYLAVAKHPLLYDLKTKRFVNA